MLLRLYLCVHATTADPMVTTCLPEPTILSLYDLCFGVKMDTDLHLTAQTHPQTLPAGTTSSNAQIYEAMPFRGEVGTRKKTCGSFDRTTRYVSCNVSTLRPREVRRSVIEGAHIDLASRITILEHTFEKAEYDIVGMQETRI